MQVILMERMPNLGNLGDVVKVKDGYARNFLIPSGRAQRATQRNVQAFETRRAELEQLQTEKLAEAQARAEKLAGYTVQVTQKAGVDGRLFGSVTAADIAAALAAQGFTVAKAEIRLPQGPFKMIGDYPISVALHSDVTASITVAVLGEHQ